MFEGQTFEFRPVGMEMTTGQEDRDIGLGKRDSTSHEGSPTDLKDKLEQDN